MVIACEHASENPIFEELGKDTSKSEEDFRIIWKLYYISLLGNIIRENCCETKEAKEIVIELEKYRLIPIKGIKGALLNVKQYFEQYIKNPDITIAIPDGPSVNYSTAIPSEHESQMKNIDINATITKIDNVIGNAKLKIWLLFDRLDVTFSQPVVEEPAIRALFRTYIDISKFQNIKLKIFLRDDIWERITRREGFREQSHITRSVTIDWDEPSLMNLLIRRVLSNECIANYLNCNVAEIFKDYKAQNKIFYKFFPLTVESGENQSKTFKWIINRIQDAKQKSAPRELIQMVNRAKEEELKLIETGQSKSENSVAFSSSCLKKAYSLVSKTKVETFFAEYADLRFALEAFKFGKSVYSGELLVKKLTKSAKKINLPVEDIIQRLIDIGFLQETDKGESYKIPFLFKPYLKIKQGKE